MFLSKLSRRLAICIVLPIPTVLLFYKGHGGAFNKETKQEPKQNGPEPVRLAH